MRIRLIGSIGTMGALACLLAFAAQEGPATQPGQKGRTRDFNQTQFSRYVESDGRPRLEVSIMTLKGEDGFTVDLVSAVHIADGSYYEDLNNRFTGYDAVLYEMVSATKNPEAPKKGAGGNSPVSMLQRGMKTMLGLTFQLDEVDYSKENFVHADMDVTSFFAAQEARGESLLGLMIKAYLAEMNRPMSAPREGGQMFKPVEFGNTPETRKRAIKLIFAQTLGDMERQAMMLDGPEGSAILTDRNDACLQVLREVRTQGKQKVAIFYGAAHMPDMAQKLTTIDKLKVAKTEWLTAWDISAIPAAPATQRGN